MFIDQGSEGFEVGSRLTFIHDRMAGHGHRKHMSRSVYSRVDCGQGLSGPMCLWSTAVQAIFKCKQWLSNRIGERYSSFVHECNFFHSPALDKG